MGYVLTNIGEEHVTENGLVTSFTFGLYDDDTDAITESDDIGAITAEPSGASYSPQSVSITSTETGSYSGDYGFQVTVTFDTSDSTLSSVDGTYAQVNFDSDVAGDGGTATDHLHSTQGPFGTQRDLSNVDTLDVTITVTIS